MNGSRWVNEAYSPDVSLIWIREYSKLQISRLSMKSANLPKTQWQSRKSRTPDIPATSNIWIVGIESLQHSSSQDLTSHHKICSFNNYRRHFSKQHQASLLACGHQRHRRWKPRWRRLFEMSQPKPPLMRMMILKSVTVERWVICIFTEQHSFSTGTKVSRLWSWSAVCIYQTPKCRACVCRLSRQWRFRQQFIIGFDHSLQVRPCLRHFIHCC